MGLLYNFSVQDFVIGLSVLSRGTIQDKLRWIFSLYDLDGDGVLTKDELYRMISAIYDLLGRSGDFHADDAATRLHVDRVYEVCLMSISNSLTYSVTHKTHACEREEESMKLMYCDARSFVYSN